MHHSWHVLEESILDKITNIELFAGAGGLALGFETIAKNNKDNQKSKIILIFDRTAA